MASFDEAYEKSTGSPPPAHLRGPIKDYWEKRVATLCDLADRWIGNDAEQERHRVYAYLVMALVYWYWNGFMYGRVGRYPLNHDPVAGDPIHIERDYNGHNIAAIAVDRRGRVIDFDFNHNDIFSSSAEHAEARLIRRLYSLTGIAATWEDAAESTSAVLPSPTNRPYVTLKDITIYTSLESCAQCAGIMALAKIRRVIYLQTAPESFWIGRVLHNLTPEIMKAPLPISGGEIGLSEFAELDEAYEVFVTRDVKREKFWEPPEGSPSDPRRSNTIGMTAFLCTSAARNIFWRGFEKLRTVPLRYADFRPCCGWPSREGNSHVCGRSCALTNAQALGEAMQFWAYACGAGRRGTPHNL